MRKWKRVVDQWVYGWGNHMVPNTKLVGTRRGALSNGTHGWKRGMGLGLRWCYHYRPCRSVLGIRKSVGRSVTEQDVVEMVGRCAQTMSDIRKEISDGLEDTQLPW